MCVNVWGKGVWCEGLGGKGGACECGEGVNVWE